MDEDGRPKRARGRLADGMGGPGLVASARPNSYGRTTAVPARHGDFRVCDLHEHRRPERTPCASAISRRLRAGGRIILCGGGGMVLWPRCGALYRRGSPGRWLAYASLVVEGHRPQRLGRIKGVRVLDVRMGGVAA